MVNALDESESVATHTHRKNSGLMKKSSRSECSYNALLTELHESYIKPKVKRSIHKHRMFDQHHRWAFWKSFPVVLVVLKVIRERSKSRFELIWSLEWWRKITWRIHRIQLQRPLNVLMNADIYITTHERPLHTSVGANVIYEFLPDNLWSSKRMQ